MEIIKKLASDMQNELTAIRREIHRRPELGFQEYQTAALVARKLRALGLEVKENVGGTGVVGLLQGSSGGNTIALRADMDALPITEQNGHEYVSQNPGVMHACGHDAHTAMLLGAAEVLIKIKEQIKGQVKFIFQPCEEAPPGGAMEMIKAGVLDNPQVDAIFGLHVDTLFPVGVVGYKEGIMMAAVDNFTIEVIGKGGHGAAPHLAIDAIVIAAEIIQSLQTIASRYVNPLEPVVLSIGTINGGYVDNVVADRVTMTGTVRTLNHSLRNELHKVIEQRIAGITKGYGATYNLVYNYSYPPLVNNNHMVALCAEAAGEIMGKGNVIPITAPSMGGEDFAYYAEKVTACFMNLGAGFADRKNFTLHHPEFDIDESALPTGTAILANVALKFFNNKL